MEVVISRRWSLVVGRRSSVVGRRSSVADLERRRLARLNDIAQQRPDPDCYAWCGSVGRDAQDAAIEGLDIVGGLIAFDCKEQIARAHMLAVTLEPLDEDAFFHRPSKPWHE